ncbi:MAG: hypothetical protein AB2693_26580, partial [Candidatus Thiodiazotropha sp.]
SSVSLNSKSLKENDAQVLTGNGHPSPSQTYSRIPRDTLAADIRYEMPTYFNSPAQAAPTKPRQPLYQCINLISTERGKRSRKKCILSSQLPAFFDQKEGIVGPC